MAAGRVGSGLRDYICSHSFGASWFGCPQGAHAANSIKAQIGLVSVIKFVHVLACFLCCARKPSLARVALVLFLLMASLPFAHPPSLTFTSNLSSLAYIRMLSSLHYDLTADEELSRLALRAVLALIPRLSLVSLCSFHANEMECIIKPFSLGVYLHS